MSTGTKIGAGFALALAIIMALGISFYVSTQRLLEANGWVTHTHLVMERLEHVLSVLKDAETGQRGYVLTGEEPYLEPYKASSDQVRSDIDSLKELTRDNPNQQARLAQLQTLANAKLAELRETIDLRRTSGLEAAVQVVHSGGGRKIMDDLRHLVGEMTAHEQELLNARNTTANTDAQYTIKAITLWTPLSLLMLACFAMLVTRKVRFGGPVVPVGNPGGGVQALRYGFAVAAVAIAAALRWWLARSFGPLPPFVTLYPAVLLVASIVGGGPGILASILAALAADYFFLPPYGRFVIEAPNDMLALGIFTCSNLFLSVFAERMRRARHAEAINVAQEEELAERKRTAMELYRQRELLSVTLNSIGDAVIACDTGGAITFLNPVAESLTGWPADEALGQPVKAVFKIIDEKSRQPAADILDVVLREKRIVMLANHTALVTRDGREVPIEDSAAPIVNGIGEVMGGVLVFHDVTQRRRAQTELHSVALFPEQDPNPVLRISADGSMPYANPAARELLDRMGWNEGLALPEPFANVAAETFQTRSSKEIEFTCKDSKVFSFQVTPVLDQDYSNFYGRDITLRKLAEQAVRENEERLRFAMETSHTGVWDLDVVEHTAFRSLDHDRIFGYAQLLPVWTYEMFLEHVLPEDRAMVHDKHQRAMETRTEWSFECRIRRTDGQIRWIWAAGRHQLDAAAPRRIAGIVQDITERKEAEEEIRRQREWLRVTLSSIGDAVLTTDAEGRVTFLNPVAERLTGWNSAEALGQPVQSVFAIINEQTRQPAENIVGRVLREGQVIALANHTALVARDGREVPIEDSAAPIRDAADSVAGVVLVFHDVAEKRRAQEKLLESEERFRTMANAIPQLAWMAQADGFIFWYNQRWYEYTGTTPEQMEGWGWQSVHDPDVLPKVLATWQTSIATGKPFDMIFPLRGADGQFRPFLTRVMPLKDAAGHVVQWFGTNTDVTEHKRAEDALRESEALLRAITDSSPDPVFLKDRDGRMLLANPATVTAIGKPAERIIGKTDEEFYDDPVIGRAMMENDRRIMDSGETEVIEETVRSTSGVLRTFLSTKTPRRDAEGRVIGLVGLARDITERKRAEEELLESRERLDLALISARMATFDWDIVNDKRIWSDGVHSLLGTSQETFAGTAEEFFQIIHPDDRSTVRAALARAIDTTGLYETEYRAIWPNGAIHHIAARGRVHHDSAGQAVLMTAVCWDITERKLAEEELRRQREWLRVTLTSIGDGVITCDTEGRVTFINPVAEALSRWKTEDALGQPIQSVFRIINEQTHEPAQDIVGRVLRDNIIVELANHTALVTRDGGEVSIEDSAAPITDSSGNVAGVVLVFHDVTDKRLAREQLKQKETELREAQRVAKVGSWHWDAKTDVITGSDELFSIYGLDPETQHVPDFREQYGRYYPAEEWRRLYAAVQETMRTGVGCELDVQAIREGAPIWVATRCEVVRDADGRVAGLSGTVQDITERKQAEDAQRDSEQQYRDLFSTLIEGFCIIEMVFDAQGKPVDYRFLVINPAFEKQTGLLDAQGKLMTDLAPDHETYWFEVYGKVALTGEPTRFVNQAKSLNRWYDVSAFRVGGPDSRKVAILFNDITDAKRMEEELRELSQRLTYHMDCSPLAVIEWGPDMRLTRWSGEAEHIFGWKAEEVLGKRMEDFRWIYTEDEPEVAEVSSEPQAGAGRFSANRNYRKDGSVAHCEWYNSSLLDESGKMRSILSLVLDVTKRNEVEEALRVANAELAEADRRKDEFLAMLAHELRNPLAPVRNAIQIMNMIGPKNPVLQKNREMVERQIGHMSRLLDDLLDVSRISRGKISLQTERLDLRTVVAQAVEVAEHGIMGRHLEIEFTQPLEPVWIEGDYTRLEQIAGNLINNAIKYTEEGKINISLTTDPSRDGGSEWCELRVRDTGIGIPPEMLPAVFDLFAQGDQSLDRRRGGLGIGLTMVEHLVKMHGGTVQARSEGLGKGSEFVIRLPLVAPAETDDARQTREPAYNKPGQGNGRRASLVVDDNVDAAQSMADIMSLWGYEVQMAHDGPTAVKLAMDNPPDVILLDIGLPGMSGYEVARLLRNEAGMDRVRIIALTGYGRDEDRRMTAESGCDAHLVKPVDLNQLYAMLSRIMAGANVT